MLLVVPSDSNWAAGVVVDATLAMVNGVVVAAAVVVVVE